MTPRKRLATLGKRGALVRLFLVYSKDGDRYVVQWSDHGKRQQQSWPATKAGKSEAEAFFKAFDAEIRKEDAPKAKLTNRELWQAFLTAEAAHLRPNTVRLYSEAWRRWEQHTSEDHIAEDTSIQTILDFRKALDDKGLATATVKDAIRNIRIVFNWGERLELIDRNRWHLFVHKVSKEKRTKPRAEYRSDEFLAIWKALNPEQRGQWRAWVAVGLLGIYGNRQQEILNLQWPWIDGDTVTIDPAFVKTGEEASLTLFPLTKGILDVARRWAVVEGYSGPYVLFPGKYGGVKYASRQAHYSIQSLTDAIHAAEKRAKVETIKWRAGHGFRRGLVGDLIDATGDVTLALSAIGDRDIGMVKHYRVKRQDKVDAAVQQRAGKLIPTGGQ